MEKAQMPQNQNPALGLGPVARALVAGTVTTVLLPPRRRRGPRFVTVTIATHNGELAVRVPADHKIYARVAARARRGDFWVVEADLVMGRGDIEIRARHLVSSRDTFLPSTVTAAHEVPQEPRDETGSSGQLGFTSW